jgi:fructose-bisphosphate aldolase class I
MNNNVLKQTIAELFSNHKGLLAMDESISTCNKRFAAVQIPETVEMRRKYRELIVTTKGLNEGIGGAILFDETLRQQTKDGIPMAEALKRNGIIPGIKVDKHAKPMAGFTGEKITEGLDGLRERLEEYKTFGMRFAKWRAVISIGENIPTLECIEANATALARYAALCQEADIVPIVEPEVLMEGNHSIDKCHHVTKQVQKILFYQLYKFKVEMEGMILKPNMIIQGMDSAERNSVDKVAEYTVNCLLASVPANVPAVAFLSGGQSPELATAHLNAINKNYKNRLPWTVSFSFARAIQQPALEAWKGKDENVEKAQKLLYKRAKLDAIARNGQYNLTMEE